MDPYAISKVLWTHKLITIPIICLTAVGCAIVFAYGPRSYEASSSFVVVTPAAPSELELTQTPELGTLADNPYLRSDPSLAAQVVAARLGSSTVAKELQAGGLSTEYKVATTTDLQLSQQLVSITSTAGTPETAVATTQRLGELMSEELVAMQSTRTLEQRYFLTAQPVSLATSAIENSTNRLRAVVILAFAGAIVLFGAVSIAEGRRRRISSRAGDPDSSDVHESEATETSDKPIESRTGAMEMVTNESTADIQVPPSITTTKASKLTSDIGSNR